ncbi:MBL fold metallo-hydrolase [Shimia sp. W99]
MQFTRRSFLKASGASAAAAGFGGQAVWAASELTVGSVRIDSLSDGFLNLPREFIFSPMPKDELGPVLAEMGVADGNLTPDCNVTLLRDGENTILFDVGSGSGFQQSAGQLLDALDAVEVAPEDITHVVFTHGHPDHLWGILDDFDEPLFYEAQHMMGRTEWEYWINPETAETIDASRTTMAVGARRRLEMMEESFVLFEDGEEILPGVAARLTPGHTPGHMAFEIRSGSESVLVVGDAIGNHHVAFARPQWSSGSDQDQERAADTRARLMDQLSTEKMRLIGFHLPHGGIGHVEKRDDGYRFVPEGA